MKTCSICGKKLEGTGKGAKTLSRPTRKFAGILCPTCVQRVIKLKSRLDDKAIRPDQVDLAYKNYVEQVVFRLEEEPKRQPREPRKKKKSKKK